MFVEKIAAKKNYFSFIFQKTVILFQNIYHPNKLYKKIQHSPTKKKTSTKITTQDFAQVVVNDVFL